MITPVNGRLLIEPTKDEKYEGIVLPEGVEPEKTDSGVIVAVDSENEDPRYAVNTKVFFNKWAADEVSEGDKKYLVILKEDILAIL